MVCRGICFMVGGPRHGRTISGVTSCRLLDRSCTVGYGAYFEYNRTIYVFRVRGR